MIQKITNIGKQLYVDQEKRTELKDSLEQNSAIKNFECRCYRKDGTIIFTEINVRAVRDSDGRLVYYEGMIHDIGERKRREDDLRKQLAELKIEIDQTKRQKDIAMLTESNFFQEVEQEIAKIDLEEFWS
jgi:hypothetical protein